MWSPNTEAATPSGDWMWSERQEPTKDNGEVLNRQS